MRLFASRGECEPCLAALGLGQTKVAPDLVLIAGEGAPWGAIRHQGFPLNTVIVSDDAGQFNVGLHALGWIHAERVVHELVPANDKQRDDIEVAKRMIWWLHESSKAHELAPSPERAEVPRALFDRSFKRAKTSQATFDRLLGRLFRNKAELPRGLERPEIPLDIDVTEYDIAPMSRSEKFPVETSANGAGRRAASRAASTRPVESSIHPFTTLSAIARVSPDPKSRTSQPSSNSPPPEAASPCPGIWPGYRLSFVPLSVP